MKTPRRLPMELVPGDRDRDLVHLGATASNEELRALVQRMKYRAPLVAVPGSTQRPRRKGDRDR